MQYCPISQKTPPPQSFLLGSRALKQRILFVSLEADAEFKCANSLMKATFMHSVSTELKDADIRQEMKPSYFMTNFQMKS
ncbi:hypothetical protein HOLleu_33572 [Holothuria leucospilota]|uniref:Uncharacterized protein n=1 Tax=Holothuria leucospilota TaxID=206669 RepID=A0A9Q1BFI7_HOLLE|nr:hypothetical protein HOLleu_33572 [Holothuria leucospilota]